MRIETKNEKMRRLFNKGHFADSSIVRDVVRLQDKELSESTRLSNIIKAAEQNSPRLALFNEFLSCNVLSQVINNKTFPKYKKPVICVAADEVLKKSFTIIQKMWFNYYDTVKPAQTEEVAVDVSDSKEVMVLGYYFMKHNDTGENLVYGVDFIEGFMTGFISMYSSDKNSKLASATMREIISWSKTNNFLKGKKIDCSGRMLSVDGIVMDDVIIADDTKRRLKSGTIDMLANAESYRKNNLPIKRGILMEGPPGTGKTLLAKALANEVDSTFIWVTPDDVQYPEHVSGIYNMARDLAPTIVLFEDIDYIGKNRSSGASGSFDKITGELLNQMDGLESNEGIITLASSNYPKALDKALRNRPGRFDIRVRFDLPDESLRTEMFARFFGDVDISDLSIEDMVQKTVGYTGAYIKELTKSIIMLAVTDKSMNDSGLAIALKKHFDEAYAGIEKSRKLDDIDEEEE